MKFQICECVKCGTALEGPGGRGGRPSRFCSAGCKTSAEAELRRLNVHLRKLEADRVFFRLNGPRSSSPERDAVIAELQARFDHLAGVPEVRA